MLIILSPCVIASLRLATASSQGMILRDSPKADRQEATRHRIIAVGAFIGRIRLCAKLVDELCLWNKAERRDSKPATKFFVGVIKIADRGMGTVRGVDVIRIPLHCRFSPSLGDDFTIAVLRISVGSDCKCVRSNGDDRGDRFNYISLSEVAGDTDSGVIVSDVSFAGCFKVID